MEQRSTAQDVHRCDLCETTIVDSYCDFCHFNLCTPCIGEHISDGYDKHKIVPFNERRSTLIYLKCGSHPNKDCELQCKDCDKIYVFVSCIPNYHNGHMFVEILQVYKSKKGVIKNDRKELENIISLLQRYIELLEKKLSILDKGFENITTKISKQDKDSQRCILQEHLDEIKQTQSHNKDKLFTLKQIEESTLVSPTVEYISENSDLLRHIIPKVEALLSKVKPHQIDSGEFERDIADIIESLTVMSLHQPLTIARKLLDNPEHATILNAGYKELRNIAISKEEQIWTSGHNDEIKCFHIKSSRLHQTIKTKLKEWHNDIAVDNNGDLLYSSAVTRSVNKVVNGRAEEWIIILGWVPSNLCVTESGDLLVTCTMYSEDTTQSKVVRYSGSTEKQTIQFDDKGKSLFSGSKMIKYITENRNQDICVADCQGGAVVVVYQNGKFRNRYTSHITLFKLYPFEPYGISTDSHSHILTADCANHCIHILDQNVQFLRYIDNCDLEDPYGLCVDNNDNLFVCEYKKGDIKEIIYLR